MPPVVQYSALGAGCQGEQDVVAGAAQPVAPGVVSDAQRVVERFEDLVLLDQWQAQPLSQSSGEGALPAGGKPGDDHEGSVAHGPILSPDAEDAGYRSEVGRSTEQVSPAE